MNGRIAIPLTIVGLLTATLGVSAQDLRRVTPPPVPAQAPAGDDETFGPDFPVDLTPDPALTRADVVKLLPAQPGEVVLLDSLRAVVLVADPADGGRGDLSVTGTFDTSRVPLLDLQDARDFVKEFLGKPASIPSLVRLAGGLGVIVTKHGHPLLLVYVPPQDITTGIVRIVAQQARLDGEVAVVGATHFAEDDYRAVLGIKPGDALDAERLGVRLDRLNRNPYRRVTVQLKPGDEPGTTHVGLSAIEARPLRVTGGFNNTGSQMTGENRLSAGVNWGNAFGRGDVAGYQYQWDPDGRRSESHSLSYVTQLSSRSALSVASAWSVVHPALPQPMSQQGHTGQATVRYTRYQGRSAARWSGELFGGAEFKYSDNNLDFAEIPITNTVTHVVQATLGMSVLRRAATELRFGGSLNLSPGGLTARNTDEWFSQTRVGATARYAYGQVTLDASRRLASHLSWQSGVNAQVTRSVLLGSEQIAGGGLGGVRGYAETAAFADQGIVAQNELHLGDWSSRLVGRRTAFAPFVFYDAAALSENGPAGTSFGLQSAGVGTRVQWDRYALDIAYGRQLQQLRAARKDGRAHINLQVGF